MSKRSGIRRNPMIAQVRNRAQSRDRRARMNTFSSPEARLAWAAARRAQKRGSDSVPSRIRYSAGAERSRRSSLLLTLDIKSTAETMRRKLAKIATVR